MHRPAFFLLKLLIFPPLIAAAAGWIVAPSFLHPVRRPLTPDLVRQADIAFSQKHTHREEFDVRASDGSILRGWKVRSADPSGDWVLLFHGVADNRMGVLEHALVLLPAGYNVVLMDARAHGTSDGVMATYGWLERNDTRAIVDALEATEHPRHLFTLGESMGAGIALQSAAVEPRIEAVAAEASFANLREASYDYAGLRRYPWLGKTLFAPGTWTMIYHAELLANLPAAAVSPEKAVAARAFPVLLICDAADVALPCRHTKRIYEAARGPKQMWIVPGAFHTAALGYEPVEFRRRVLALFDSVPEVHPESEAVAAAFRGGGKVPPPANLTPVK
jgi:alpha-beta hydrolase superfamily lysophospholipase